MSQRDVNHGITKAFPASFHQATLNWFNDRFAAPTRAQSRSWEAIARGDDTLTAAPTGSGKTLAAFLAALDRLFQKGCDKVLEPYIYVLYISPLKALSSDVQRNLDAPLHGLTHAFATHQMGDIAVKSAVRTGDTDAAKRAQIVKSPPHILATTPESLFLMLTSESGRRALSRVETVIVDEIHALADGRRGAHLMVSLERLDALVLAEGASKRPQRIGLSATQKPLSLVADFLTGQSPRGCTIIDEGHRRTLDLSLELPSTPLEAVMSTLIWEEIYDRLAELILAHKTTLIFVNTRRLAERVTHHLESRLNALVGEGQITSHHGSLSQKLRLNAEQRLKAGELRALVATASLELGIDIGSVDLVCQIGTTSSIATFLQRVGRSNHQLHGVPKGRLFPLSRDELVESLALMRCVRRSELDALIIPESPLDILAQHIVAASANETLGLDELFALTQRAYPYRHLTRDAFDDVVHMLADGITTRRGRRAAHIHVDAVNGTLRGRRGARLAALTSGGAIPDKAEYRVTLQPGDTYLGTLDEHFAIDSVPGDVFLLGSNTWRVSRISDGQVFVQDAAGQPPNVPFWFGEAPARTQELSAATSELRREIDEHLSLPEEGEAKCLRWLQHEFAIDANAAAQLVAYFSAGKKLLGVVPTQQTIVAERFFDESGGMQLILHAPFGQRINRAWGLALRKRFCRSFNFELQAAATDDAIVLSLGEQHSFPLADVFKFLPSSQVADILVQAILDAPIFQVRWRWNASRSLAMLRHRNGKRVPAHLQRMQAEDLIGAVFPQQLACLENIVGDREIPDHPLVKQTLDDCTTEAMDLPGLQQLLRQIEVGTVECIARDVPEPSVFSHEILTARPWAYLDDAPLEERRTRAVTIRRGVDTTQHIAAMGSLDSNAIERVQNEAWPRVTNADEMHDALMQLGLIEKPPAEWLLWLEMLSARGRSTVLSLDNETQVWVATERVPQLTSVFASSTILRPVNVPTAYQAQTWERDTAVRELIRGQMEVAGPTTVLELASNTHVASDDIDIAMLALEAEGFILRGHFKSGLTDLQWCDRRLLARIHRMTLTRLRAEIAPVTVQDFVRFLLIWQRVEDPVQGEGPDALMAVATLLDGYEAAAAAWETDILPARLQSFRSWALDACCATGQLAWGRLTGVTHLDAGDTAGMPLRSSPIALFERLNLPTWASQPAQPQKTTQPSLSQHAESILNILKERGALFATDLCRALSMPRDQAAHALGELVTLGQITSDSFAGLRALLSRTTSLDQGGRWVPLTQFTDAPASSELENQTILEHQARVYLRRWGVVCRRVLEREAYAAPWRDLLTVYRRLEARGEVRGGHFIAGVGGEQFATPEALKLLRDVRHRPLTGKTITLSAADPLNLTGYLLPGPRIPASSKAKVDVCDGVIRSALEA